MYTSNECITIFYQCKYINFLLIYKINDIICFIDGWFWVCVVNCLFANVLMFHLLFLFGSFFVSN